MAIKNRVQLPQRTKRAKASPSQVSATCVLNTGHNYDVKPAIYLQYDYEEGEGYVFIVFCNKKNTRIPRRLQPNCATNEIVINFEKTYQVELRLANFNYGVVWLFLFLLCNESR